MENKKMTTSWLYVSPDVKTFSHDEYLPSLPVPPQHRALQKYLDSVKPHVTEEEFEETRKLVEDFENGDGPELHALLEERSRKKRNWLEKWWEDMAYLTSRASLMPFLNMTGYFPTEDYNSSDLDPQWGITALQTHYAFQFWQLLRQEKLRPHISQDFTWSMHQFRRLFNTTRIPGVEKDTIESWFVPESEGPSGPTHVIVLCNGHIFKFEAFPDGRILLPQEIIENLKYVDEYAKTHPPGPGVGILTSTDRSLWAHNRAYLSSLDSENESILHLIDTSLFVLVLEGYSVDSRSELLKKTMAGDLKNRWADKSLMFITFSNQKLGMNCDHAPYDGMVSVVLGHFTLLCIEEGYSDWKSQQVRILPNPSKLEFMTDNYIHEQVDKACVEAKSRIDEVSLLNRSFTDFGKEAFRKYHLKPEAFVQMGLQLAYYKAHKKFAPTYVTATTRKFYHGRTETVRSCLSEIADWATAMEAPNFSMQQKRNLFDKAITRLCEEMTDAMNNDGCDRYLFGLYMIAQEYEKPVPTLFFDPSFIKSGGNGNYVLSTSLTGYTKLFGTVMPMREDGYGVFYAILDKELIFTITNFKSHPETDPELLFSKLEESYRQIRVLLTETSKL